MTISFDVTRHRLILGARDATTKHRALTYEESTIEMLINPRGSRKVPLPPGIYVRLDAVGLTQDASVIDDKIEEEDGTFWMVEASQDWKVGDSFLYRSVDLRHLPHHFGTQTYTSSVQTAAGAIATDARVKTIAYIEAYYNFHNAVDNLGNALGVQCMFDNPQYSLTRELLAPSVVDVLQLVGKPRSTPQIDARQKVVEYDEEIPITLASIDKYAVTGTLAVEQVERELRRVLMEYPFGSMRSLERIEDKTVNVGGDQVDMVDLVFKYTRDTET